MNKIIGAASPQQANSDTPAGYGHLRGSPHQIMKINQRSNYMRKIFVCLVSIYVGIVCTQGFARNSHVTTVPDRSLLHMSGPIWWYQTSSSPNPTDLYRRAPKLRKQAVIEKASALLGSRSAKAIALVDGDDGFYSDFKALANATSLFFGYFMGKTVTSMTAGKAICERKLSFDTKAVDLLPELKGEDLGHLVINKSETPYKSTTYEEVLTSHPLIRSL